MRWTKIFLFLPASSYLLGIFFLPGVFFLSGLFFLAGCQSTKTFDSSSNSKVEVKDSLKSVLGALSSSEVDDQDLKKLEKDIRTNPETRSAVEAITDSVSGIPKEIKYCPETGKRYASHIQVCPKHQIELLEVTP